jgi:large subunit ribosomal protein L25
MKVIAFERSLHGTGASRRLRNSGKTPAIVYGATGEPQLLELDHNALFHALKKEAFHSSILDLEIAGKTEPVLLRDVQYHPWKQIILHVDFQRVDPTKKLHTKVPLHFMNQETSKAVKFGGAVLTHVMNEVDVACLPGNLPEFIEVDLGEVEIGKSLHVKDLKLPQGVELSQHLEQENPVFLSVTVPAAVVAEGDAAAPAAPAEGAAPAA